jgi:hypothetical protein
MHAGEERATLRRLQECVGGRSGAAEEVGIVPQKRTVNGYAGATGIASAPFAFALRYVLMRCCNAAAKAESENTQAQWSRVHLGAGHLSPAMEI